MIRNGQNRRENARQASELERESTSRRRTSLPITLWRWRYELVLILSLVSLGFFVVHTVGVVVTVIGASAAIGALSPPWPQRLTALLWHLVTPHLLRTGLAQARIHNRNGIQPFIVRVTRKQFGERVRLWCPAGTCAEDIASARATLRAACWAADIRVWRDEQHSQIVTIDVIRRSDI